MKYKIEIDERVFHFKQPAGPSRGVYNTRTSWFVKMTSPEMPGRVGVGECAPLPDLSCDFISDYESVLRSFCDRFEQDGVIDYDAMADYPSMLFGLETALLNFNAGNAALFDTPFSRGEVGIPINGLVWMGSHDEMLQRIEEKIRLGFRCIKLKIGAIDFDSELDLIKRIRERFSSKEMELRLDANGAFSFDEALYKLEILSQYSVHSIEQPIKAHQWGDMAQLCRESPLPVALDEELIGINTPEMKSYMINVVKPAYIIIKPSLHGGMHGAEEWIDAAESHRLKSWITCSLKSNVVMNDIAIITAHVYGPDVKIHQGLGTGMLFTDNIDMPINISGERLKFKV